MLLKAGRSCILFRPIPARCDCGLSPEVVVLPPRYKAGGVPGVLALPRAGGGGKDGIKDGNSAARFAGEGREVCVGGLGKAEYDVLAGLGSGTCGAALNPGDVDASERWVIALFRLAKEDFRGMRPPLEGVVLEPIWELDGDIVAGWSPTKARNYQRDVSSLFDYLPW